MSSEHVSRAVKMFSGILKYQGDTGEQVDEPQRIEIAQKLLHQVGEGRCRVWLRPWGTKKMASSPLQRPSKPGRAAPLCPHGQRSELSLPLVSPGVIRAIWMDLLMIHALLPNFRA